MNNHAADSKIGPPKIDFRADETHESHPTAWELIYNFLPYGIVELWYRYIL